MTDCPVPDHRVQQRPCTDSATERNWDAQVAFNNKLKEFMACANDSGVKRFRLTAALDVGGTAAAVLLSRESGAWVTGAAITVRDVDEEHQGFINHEGWCVSTGGEYLIETLQRRARWIDYTLNETLAGISAEATVDRFHDGLDPGATVDVYDPEEKYTFWHQDGNTGTAKWNERLKRYEIVRPVLAAKFLDAVLTGNLCDSATADVTVLAAYVQGMHQETPDPLPTTAGNSFNHHALLGDAVRLIGRVSGGVLLYDIDKVELQFAWAVINVVQDDCEFNGTKQKIYVESCVELDDFDIATLTQLDVPYSFSASSVLTGGSPYCKITAATRTVCVIDIEEGPSIDVLSAVSTTVLTDVDWTYDHSDDDNPSTVPTCVLTGTTRVIWALCVGDPSSTTLIEFTIQDVVTGFTLTDNTDECKGVLTTTKFCMLKPQFEAADIDGDPITIFDCTKVNVVTNIIDAGDTIDAGFRDLFVICTNPGTEDTVIVIEECPADEVIDEGEV